jgi:hypothetical protein
MLWRRPQFEFHQQLGLASFMQIASKRQTCVSFRPVWDYLLVRYVYVSSSSDVWVTIKYAPWVKLYLQTS